LYDLRQILEEREVWRGQIESLKRMRQWVRDAEHILDGSWAEQTDGKKIQDKDTPNALPDHLKTKKEKHTSKKKALSKK